MFDLLKFMDYNYEKQVIRHEVAGRSTAGKFKPEGARCSQTGSVASSDY